METAGVRYCQTESEHHYQSIGVWNCSHREDKGRQQWKDFLQSGAAPVPRGPDWGLSAVGKGAKCPQEQGPFYGSLPILLSPPEPKGTCCLWEQMLRSCLQIWACKSFGHAHVPLSRAQEALPGPANQDCLSANLGLKLIVLVLPV